MINKRGKLVVALVCVFAILLALAMVSAAIAVGCSFGAAAGWAVTAVALAMLCVACLVAIRWVVRLGESSEHDT